jgi:hypothetical protein
VSGRRPWCCPEPRCTPLHAIQGGEKPLGDADPGEAFVCFGAAPEVRYEYDGVVHVNDTRSCHFTPLKGLIAYQENADDWHAMQHGYRRALDKLGALRSPQDPDHERTS